MAAILSALVSSVSSISKPRSEFSFSNLLMSHNRQTQTLRFRSRRIMCVGGLKKKHNEFKILIVHEQSESPQLSLLSTEEEDNNNSILSIPCGHCFGYPVDSCRGLMLSGNGYCHQDSLALWNLSTKEFIKTLPPPPSVQLDPAFIIYGLGFDPKESDYKVIKFLEFEDVDHTKYLLSECLVELYSLKTDTWKPIAYPHPKETFLGSLSNISINEFNYWSAFAGPFENADFVIIRFDFANDTFPLALIPAPPTHQKIKHMHSCYELAEFEGSLAVILVLDPPEYDDKESAIEYERWVWDANNESWSRRGEWAFNGGHYPLGLFNNNQLFLQSTGGDRELLLFDCVKQELKNLGLYAIGDDDVHVLPFIDSSAKEIDE